MSTGDFWDDVQSALGELDGSTESAVELLTGATREELDELGGFEVSAEAYDRLSRELREPGRVIEPLLAALMKPRRVSLPDPMHTCPKCGGYARRWYAASDGDGDVEPRAQCDRCEWGF